MKSYQMKSSMLLGIVLAAFVCKVYAAEPAPPSETEVGQMTIDSGEAQKCTDINKLAKSPANTIRVEDYIETVNAYTATFNSTYKPVVAGKKGSEGITFYKRVVKNGKPTEEVDKKSLGYPDLRRYKLPDDFDKGQGVAIQLAIDECFKKGATGSCDLYFKGGTEYSLSAQKRHGRVYYAGLVLTGSNVNVHGCGATITNSSQLESAWGDTVNVVGLIYGKFYPQLRSSGEGTEAKGNEDLYGVSLKGLAADKLFSNGKKGGYLVGAGMVLSQKIKINNLTIKESTTDTVHESLRRNCVSLMHTQGVTVENVLCDNSPQTSFAVISAGGGNDPDKPLKRLDTGVPYKYITENRNVLFNNVTSSKSRIHAFRFVQIDGGQVLTATLSNSKSLSVDERGDKEGEVLDENGEKKLVGGWPYKNVPQHVIYRALVTTNDANAEVTLSHNYFDESANIMAHNGVSILTIKNNTIKGGVYLKNHTARKIIKDKIVKPPQGFSELTIKGNAFNCNNQLPSVVSMYAVVSPSTLKSDLAGPIAIANIEGGMDVPVDGKKVAVGLPGGMSGNFVNNQKLDKNTLADGMKKKCVNLSGTALDYFLVN